VILVIVIAGCVWMRLRDKKHRHIREVYKPQDIEIVHSPIPPKPVPIRFSKSPEINRLTIDEEPEYLEGVELSLKLGQGNFGSVYKATWQGSEVAVKIVQSEVRKKVETEATILKKLNHPNIIRYYGLARPMSNDMFVVMEYMSLGSLDKLMKSDPEFFSVEEVQAMCYDVAAGMSYLHNQFIIHRDLALRNLLVKQEDSIFVVKIADFGLSRFVDEKEYTISNSHVPGIFKVLNFVNHIAPLGVYSFVVGS
jgi:tRNA A-37 threonylcarbamoyl transferase component Bud32